MREQCKQLWSRRISREFMGQSIEITMVKAEYTDGSVHIVEHYPTEEAAKIDNMPMRHISEEL